MKRLIVSGDGKTVVITAFADYNPLQQLSNISSELEKIQFCGGVVFDLLYTNGNSDNRFVKIMFDGSKFDRKSFVVISNIDNHLKREQDYFFRNHPDFLKGSILSSSELTFF
ncbi:MAG: type II toxin-antitoxin system RnlB family antitoxin [Methylococcales bacterium]|jgi:hypothetical protein|nr:type II toxin-antitoxin system RnlB family antitoxin [Methylococcales bacterium]MDP3840115.1 type II toxin-antitoxin system RnlB family antitoxin [Methylococcales bacterium]